MKDRKQIIQKVIILAVYAVAMAVVEAAVVVYMRELYYPQGFVIHSISDLAAVSKMSYWVELWREIATLVMISAVSLLAYEKWSTRFTAFVWTFSVWDIVYYVFLYVFIKWPPSFSTIDVYFLLPWPLLGPVWFPIALFSFLGVLSFWSLLKYHD